MRDSYGFLAISTCLVLCLVLVGRPVTVGAQETEFGDAESVVEELYKLVTFDAGTTPDWDQVRSLFLDQAVIAVRTSMTETGVFSVDGFVEDFVQFIERANVGETGFIERIVRTKPLVFGDIAHILVLYEAQIPSCAGHLPASGPPMRCELPAPRLDRPVSPRCGSRHPRDCN